MAVINAAMNNKLQFWTLSSAALSHIISILLVHGSLTHSCLSSVYMHQDHRTTLYNSSYWNSVVETGL